MTISAVVLTKNEEENIAVCLASLSWCNEIVVVDDSSLDKTKQIAKKYKATVVAYTGEHDFANKRNFGLTKAKGEWVFFVDADERVTHALKQEILRLTSLLQNDKINGFFVKRQDYLWGKPLLHGEQGNGTFLRLAKKGKGLWSGKVHEVWNISGEVGMLENPLIHFPHPSLAEFLSEINHYSTLRAQELYKKGVRANFLSILAYPKAKFIQDYIFKYGFLDGMEGFIVALLMSLHSFLVRGKLWQLSKN